MLTAALPFYRNCEADADRRVDASRSACSCCTVGETVTVVLNVVLAYLFRGELFINELMSKKLAIGGVLVLS